MLRSESALYVPDGDAFVPTGLTRGPWDPGAQHGGAPAALLMRAVEAVPTPAPMAVARLTVELLRPVPLTPLHVEVEVTRPGRKVQTVAASLRAGEVEVARATALLVRRSELPLPADADLAEPSVPGPERARAAARFPGDAEDLVAYHTTAVELRFVRGGLDVAGPAVGWARLAVAVVEGEAPSPSQRVAAVADFGNGISWVLPMAEWLFINPDLTIHLVREPEGEWVGLTSVTLPGSGGMGLAESALSDRRGRIGRSVQSLLLERRG